MGKDNLISDFDFCDVLDMRIVLLDPLKEFPAGPAIGLQGEPVQRIPRLDDLPDGQCAA